jgi:hypothetical protein
MVIFKGQIHQQSWYNNIPSNWLIGVSENRWTTDELDLIWLKRLFGPNTQNQMVGKYQLLILDGHGSHVTAKFNQYCTQNSIIVLCMPLHSSHLLQPLDVSCFAVLKQSYGSVVQEQMQAGINHVDKDNFLDLYLQAHIATYSSKTIQSSFKATSLVPFNPDKVLSQLYIQLNTPLPVQPILEASAH